MPFQNATKDLSQDKSHSSLHLIGGVDSDPNFVRKPCDLRVEGGSITKKTALVLGNIVIGDKSKFILGNLCGSIFTDHIQEKEPGQGITLLGNIDIPEIDASLITANIISSEFIQSEIIESNVIVVNTIESNEFGEIKLEGDVMVCGNIVLGGASYVPSTPSDWNGIPPSTISEALDRCATLLSVLNGGTGP